MINPWKPGHAEHITAVLAGREPSCGDVCKFDQPTEAQRAAEAKRLRKAARADPTKIAAAIAAGARCRCINWREGLPCCRYRGPHD